MAQGVKAVLQTCSDARVSLAFDTCRFAPPLAAVWQALTFVANRSEQTVSFSDAASGLTFTNINVLPSPPKHGCSTKIASQKTAEQSPQLARRERLWL